MALLGYDIYSDSLDVLDLKSTKTINTINPHSYCTAKKDDEFMKALKESDVLLPDGIGIVWAERVLNGRKINRIAGYDLFIFLMNHLNETSGSCFFLGASEETLSKIENKLSVDYPNVKVKSYSPPYRPSFTEEESMQMCDEVNKLRPDVLFVGMTAPKQEKWVHNNKNRLEATTICSIGAVFDFYAGNIKRSSQFWISLGLEWLPRFLKEPRRLAKRNLVSTPSFIFEVLKTKVLG
ncbi:WecB/TagA/CpsF family glycosyltransferase [Winogradskyella sp.]|uniref:WecB/TagA/CpsF family glycosyltransferase n=1 Tax=Winogradskyella sp. TaxID=1883156 RepID=UPI00262E1E00|nr:WecB/TagA/CpsF family glycosyltransferase [Winogradskyella sp.]